VASEPIRVIQCGGPIIAPYPLQPTETATWIGTATSPFMKVVPIAALLLLLAIAVSYVRTHQLNMVSMGLVVPLVAVWVALTKLTVVIGVRGLPVAFGPVQWPRVRIPLDRIERVSTLDVRPTEWGGWGYRGSLTVMRQAAVVLRGGPGIRLDLHGSKTFVVTVDDAVTGASLLEALRARNATRRD
jgi:hypothetical protein